VPTWTAPYKPLRGAFDEALRPDGSPRPGYERLIEAVLADPGQAAATVHAALEAAGVEFGPATDRRVFRVDPLPRLISGDEWSRIEAGLRQRARALNLFLRDAYGERRIVAAGIVPARVIDESILYEPLMRDAPVPVVAHVAGPDLVRDEHGELRVLEDNLRTPSGLAYALAGRDAVTAVPSLPELPAEGLDGAIDLLATVIASADPTDGGEPGVALLSDGAGSNAWFEHRDLARRLGVPLVTPDELRLRDGRLVADPRADGGTVEIDVLYNRSSFESLRDRHGHLNSLGELLAGPLADGRLAAVNSFGSGIADDKAAHCYVEEMIRFYLGENPLLTSVPSLDLGDPAAFADAIDRVGELVFKPRWDFGGHGIVFGPSAGPGERRELEAALRESPGDFVAQEPVALSTHPTVGPDGLEPRRVDLRPFVYSAGDEALVLPGGLTRFAGSVDELVVNSTRGGGAKDTWVLR